MIHTVYRTINKNRSYVERFFSVITIILIFYELKNDVLFSIHFVLGIILFGFVLRDVLLILKGEYFLYITEVKDIVFVDPQTTILLGSVAIKYLGIAAIKSVPPATKGIGILFTTGVCLNQGIENITSGPDRAGLKPVSDLCDVLRNAQTKGEAVQKYLDYVNGKK